MRQRIKNIIDSLSFNASPWSVFFNPLFLDNAIIAERSE